MTSAARTYAMLGKETLWDAARRAHEVLAEAGLAHALVGGVAVCLHGYERNTVDVDFLVRRDEAPQARAALEADGWTWNDEQKELRSPAGIVLQFLIAGDKAGRDTTVKLPDPGDAEFVTELEGLPVVSLARLIESKLACGQGDLRRTHKDFADVVELIAAHNLDGSFARHIHASLRETYRELVRHARSG
jgi:hypothetical protein